LGKFARVSKKGARFKVGWDGWLKKNVHFLKLRSVALNCAGLRKIARVVALFCTGGCTTNDQEFSCQRSKRGFLHV